MRGVTQETQDASRARLGRFAESACAMNSERGHTARQALAVLALSVILAAGCADTTAQSLNLGGIEPGVCAISLDADVMIQRVVELVNEERVKIGLDPVRINLRLTNIADEYACRMITEGFFAHRDPEGEGPGERAIRGGYAFLRLGENLAAGQVTPEQAMAEWMASTAGHRENILSPEWSEIGVGVRLGGEHDIYWVQEFGDPPLR